MVVCSYQVTYFEMIFFVEKGFQFNQPFMEEVEIFFQFHT